MSSSDRRQFLALAAAGLVAGCGFRPLHKGPEGAFINRQLAAIEVITPETRAGQILKNQLLQDLNPAGLDVPARYRLVVRLEQAQKALAIQLDDSTTRYDLTLGAFFQLLPQGRDEVLYRSAVRRVASYNVLTEPFATLIAEQDAERRASVEVSRQIRTLLTLYLAEEPRPEAESGT